MHILRPGFAMICTRVVVHERAVRLGFDRLFDATNFFVEHSTARVVFWIMGATVLMASPPVTPDNGVS